MNKIPVQEVSTSSDIHTFVVVTHRSAANSESIPPFETPIQCLSNACFVQKAYYQLCGSIPFHHCVFLFFLHFFFRNILRVIVYPFHSVPAMSQTVDHSQSTKTSRPTEMLEGWLLELSSAVLTSISHTDFWQSSLNLCHPSWWGWWWVQPIWQHEHRWSPREIWDGPGVTIRSTEMALIRCHFPPIPGTMLDNGESSQHVLHFCSWNTDRWCAG